MDQYRLNRRNKGTALVGGTVDGGCACVEVGVYGNLYFPVIFFCVPKITL
jgi:hypothetical protein